MRPPRLPPAFWASDGVSAELIIFPIRGLRVPGRFDDWHRKGIKRNNKASIEERDPAEVLPRAEAEKLPFVRVRNPAFDVTPAEYVDLIVTEQGAIPPGLAFTVIRDYLGWKIEELR